VHTQLYNIRGGRGFQEAGVKSRKIIVMCLGHSCLGRDYWLVEFIGLSAVTYTVYVTVSVYCRTQPVSASVDQSPLSSLVKEIVQSSVIGALFSCCPVIGRHVSITFGVGRRWAWLPGSWLVVIGRRRRRLVEASGVRRPSSGAHF